LAIDSIELPDRKPKNKISGWQEIEGKKTFFAGKPKKSYLLPLRLVATENKTHGWD